MIIKNELNRNIRIAIHCLFNYLKCFDRYTVWNRRKGTELFESSKYNPCDVRTIL
jgi:hypothetical protein